MRKHFSDEQIISILCEAEAGVSARELFVSTPFPTPPSTPSVRNMKVTEIKHLKSLEEENAKLKKLVAEAMVLICDVTSLTKDDLAQIHH